MRRGRRGVGGAAFGRTPGRGAACPSRIGPARRRGGGGGAAGAPQRRAGSAAGGGGAPHAGGPAGGGGAPHGGRRRRGRGVARAAARPHAGGGAAPQPRRGRRDRSRRRPSGGRLRVRVLVLRRGARDDRAPDARAAPTTYVPAAMSPTRRCGCVTRAVIRPTMRQMSVDDQQEPANERAPDAARLALRVDDPQAQDQLADARARRCPAAARCSRS